MGKNWKEIEDIIREFTIIATDSNYRIIRDLYNQAIIYIVFNFYIHFIVYTILLLQNRYLVNWIDHYLYRGSIISSTI